MFVEDFPGFSHSGLKYSTCGPHLFVDQGHDLVPLHDRELINTAIFQFDLNAGMDKKVDIKGPDSTDILVGDGKSEPQFFNQSVAPKQDTLVGESVLSGNLAIAGKVGGPPAVAFHLFQLGFLRGQNQNVAGIAHVHLSFFIAI